MVIVRNPEVCAAELDGEICLFEPVKAQYLNLNSTASAIWNLLEEPKELDHLLEALQNRYEVDLDICRQQTEAFLGEAFRRGMLLKKETT